jgi:MinD-like ATPase involved in chromosome partitioning or flagellar assembly
MKPTPRGKPEPTARPADPGPASWSDPAAPPAFSAAPSPPAPPVAGAWRQAAAAWQQSDGARLPTPQSGADSWDAVLSAEPSPSRADDPWAPGPTPARPAAAGAETPEQSAPSAGPAGPAGPAARTGSEGSGRLESPGSPGEPPENGGFGGSAGALGRLDDPEQALWTPPPVAGPPLRSAEGTTGVPGNEFRPTSADAADRPGLSDWPDRPSWGERPDWSEWSDRPDRPVRRPSLGGLVWPAGRSPEPAQPAAAGPADGRGRPAGADDALPAAAETGWSPAELGSTGSGPAGSGPAGSGRAGSGRAGSGPAGSGPAGSGPAGWSAAELGSAAAPDPATGDGHPDRSEALPAAELTGDGHPGGPEARPAAELTDDEWLAHLRGAGPDQETSSRPDWARPLGPPSWPAPDRPAPPSEWSAALDPRVEPDPPPAAVDRPQWTVGDGAGHPVPSDVDEPGSAPTSGSLPPPASPKWTESWSGGRPEKRATSRGPWGGGRTDNGGEPVSEEWERDRPRPAPAEPDESAVSEQWADPPSAPRPAWRSPDSPADPAPAEPQTASWSTGSPPSAQPSARPDAGWASGVPPAAPLGSGDVGWTSSPQSPPAGQGGGAPWAGPPPGDPWWFGHAGPPSGYQPAPGGPPPGWQGTAPDASADPPPTVEELTAQSLLRQRRPTPQTGWRRAVYTLTAHALNPGQSPEDRRRQELIARASVPVRGCYRIAVISLKGGVGKTTTTVTLGATLASLRGDRVIAVDANPDRGTLSGKIPLETVATVRNLLNDVDSIHHYFDVRRYTSQSADRLEVLASESDPAVSTAFSEGDYRTVAAVLERFYNIVLTDCGTGLLHSAMAGVLDLADQIVLVSSGSVDGARSASATLDWLEAHGRGELVRNSVAVINSVRPKSGGVDLDKLHAHFAARCRAVTRIPYDPHLEEGAEVDLGELSAATRAALLELAAEAADAFPRDVRPMSPPPFPGPDGLPPAR